MRKTALIGITLLVSLVITSAVSADTPAPGGPFSTAFRVQNLSSLVATCTYTLYNSSGTGVYTSALTNINPGDSMFVYTPGIGSLPAGTYSGQVNCSEEVAAVANFSDANSGASHNGISAPGTVWYAPGIYDNYYNFYSNIVAQNATGSPVNVTVEIFAPGNPVPVVTQNQSSVPAYASVSFEQEGLTGLSNNIPYSAKITGTGDIAPVVNIYGRSTADNQLYSYNPIPAGSTTVNAPVVLNDYYDYNSALVIQNIGGSATTVTVMYSSGHSHSQSVASNSAWSIYVPTQGPAGLPSGNSGGLLSATITSSSQPIIVLVNESNNYNRAASYIGFASGTTEARAPVLEKRYFNYNSSVTCQVISGGPATMTIEYFSGGVSLGSTTSPSKANGQTHLFYQPQESYLANGFLGSGTITSAGQIACVVNQDQNEGSQATTFMDQLFAYEGVAP